MWGSIPGEFGLSGYMLPLRVLSWFCILFNCETIERFPGIASVWWSSLVSFLRGVLDPSFLRQYVAGRSHVEDRNGK